MASTPITPKADPLAGVGEAYPALKPYLDRVIVSQGKTRAGDPRQLEFYPPWERDNPHPGWITLELFNQALKGNSLRDALAGDLLHYLGGTDPRTDKPVDPAYYALKQAVTKARTPQQIALDQRLYGEARRGGDKRTLEDWLNESRIDAYIRGFVTPDAQDEWRRHGFYSDPAMLKAVQAVESYIKKGKAVK